MTNTTPNRVDPAARSGPPRPGPRAGASGRLAASFGLSLLAATPAAGLDLSLPGNARETARQETSPDSYLIATGPFTDGALPGRTVDGAVSRAAWRIGAQGITTLQVLAPLRDQLAAEGFDILYECAATACGGFDFRYAVDVFPEPAMHVDLFDYRYLAASRGSGDAAEHVALLVSRSAAAGFVQIAAIAPAGTGAPRTAASGAPLNHVATAAPAPGGGTLAARLESRGHAVLSDLTFETGSSSLGPGSFASLAELASFLAADPARRVALVGHTDAVGPLDGNIALSKRRAASVVERLVTAHGVARSQLAAEGMGYLSPITTNLTAEGREANRRVEAVLLDTD